MYEYIRTVRKIGLALGILFVYIMLKKKTGNSDFQTLLRGFKKYIFSSYLNDKIDFYLSLKSFSTYYSKALCKKCYTNYDFCIYKNKYNLCVYVRMYTNVCMYLCMYVRIQLKYILCIF